jgi:hypothetical protein
MAKAPLEKCESEMRWHDNANWNHLSVDQDCVRRQLYKDLSSVRNFLRDSTLLRFKSVAEQLKRVNEFVLPAVIFSGIGSTDPAIRTDQIVEALKLGANLVPGADLLAILHDIESFPAEASELDKSILRIEYWLDIAVCILKFEQNITVPNQDVSEISNEKIKSMDHEIEKRVGGLDLIISRLKSVHGESS